MRLHSTALLLLLATLQHAFSFKTVLKKTEEKLNLEPLDVYEDSTGQINGPGDEESTIAGVGDEQPPVAGVRDEQQSIRHGVGDEQTLIAGVVDEVPLIDQRGAQEPQGQGSQPALEYDSSEISNPELGHEVDDEKLQFDDREIAPEMEDDSSESAAVHDEMDDPPVSYCNFDTSMCRFVQDKRDKFDWTRRRGRTPSSRTGPSADHTSGRGYYMYIEASYPRRLGDNAKLHSPLVRFTGRMCLRFFYHMYGSTIGRLKVMIGGRTVFSVSGNKGNRWIGARITITRYGLYRVTFEGIRGRSFTGDIAIDDYSLSTGSCTSPAHSCNFDRSLCRFVQDKRDKFDWTRRRGSTPSFRTGPSADHTSRRGYYMYIETSYPRRLGDNAKLHSPLVRFTGRMCLRFFYHMYGSTIGRLNVMIGGRTVFSASGNKGNRWIGARITTTRYGLSRVTFEGIRGRSFTGDIAIDDYSLSRGSCSPGFSCNFDRSMCGFVQDKRDKFDWTRRRGSTPSFRTGPSADHTSRRGYYMYIETSYPRKLGDNARLISPLLRFRGIMCLRFYYHMYGSTIGRLNLMIDGRRVFSTSGNKGNRWIGARITTVRVGFARVIFEGIRGSSFTGDIAIDDVSLRSGSCSLG